MSLGAGRETVVWMVLRSSLSMTLAGIALGLPLCLWLTRLASGLLFGVQPNDPSVLAGTAAVLVAVSALAAAIPARRSSRVDPVTALRSE